MTDYRLSRRSVLRGLGVTMALPWLESLPVWGDAPGGASRASEPPVRLAVLFGGNGFHSTEWSARGEGKNLKLGKVLEPLDDFREKVLFIRGLYNAGGDQGEHPQLADGQPALGRAPGLGRRDPIGDEHGSGRRPAARPIDQGAQPGAGLREVERVGPPQLLDAV